MTENGKKTLECVIALERKKPKRDGWFEAKEITEIYEGKYPEDLEDRSSPVMTISSYLTHLKREGLMERLASKDKLFAWWAITKKGRRAVDA